MCSHTRVITGAAAILLLVSLAVPARTAGTDQNAGSEQLVKEKGRFTETLVQPDLDLGRYQSLYLAPAEVQLRPVDSPHTGSLLGTRAHKGARELQAEQQRLQKLVDQALHGELAELGQLRLSPQPEEDGLILRTAVLDVVTNIPPRTLRDTYLWHLGEATVQLELAEAGSGRLLLRLQERRSMEPPARDPDLALSSPSVAARVWFDLDRWARRTAADLRHELERRLPDQDG